MKNLIRCSIIAASTIVASQFGHDAQGCVMLMSFGVLYIIPGLAWAFCMYSRGPNHIRKWLLENSYKVVAIEPVVAKKSPFPIVDSLQLVFRVEAQNSERTNKELWFLFGGEFWGCLNGQVKVQAS